MCALVTVVQTCALPIWKGSSSLSLASVLAATGKSLVLVDADIRNPSLNRYLEMPNNKGLSHYLSGDDSLEEMIATLPQFGFALMTAGKKIGRAHAELQSLMRISYAVFCLKKKTTILHITYTHTMTHPILTANTKSYHHLT